MYMLSLKNVGLKGKAVSLAMCLWVLFFAACNGANAQLKDATTGETPMWNKLRSGVFDNRPIQMDAESMLTLEIPARAEDAATVPVAIRSKATQDDKRYVQRMWLLIENNPSPVAAVFNFTPLSGRAEIETRVRVEEYSPVRAVAEWSDGKLYAVSKFIKASGGCSAPAGKDAALAKANLGKMRLKVDAQQQGGAVLAQLMVSHPNDSGLAMDQLTRTYDKPHFVRRIEVTYGGNLVMSADVDFSISENPNFRFYFIPKSGEGALEAKVIDNQELAFSSRMVLSSAVASKSN